MAKNKGVRYIANTLKKTYNKDYPRYTDALPEARRVFAQLKDGRLNVNKKNIKYIIKPPKPKLKGGPELPKAMLSEMDYFMLNDYIGLIASSPKNIYFTSEIFPATIKQPLQGGREYTYENLFSPFVDYFNAIQKQSVDAADGRYTPTSDWVLVKTEKPTKQGKKFIAKIVFETNLKFDYGWDPKKASATPKEDLVAPVIEKEKPAEPKKESPKTDIELEKLQSAERVKLAEIEAETIRQKNKEKVASAERLFEKGKITLEQYMDLIK